MKTFIKNFFTNLRGSDVGMGTKLNVISILLLIAFDFFFFFQTLQGVENQGSHAIRPDIIVPYECQDLARTFWVQNTNVSVEPTIQAAQLMRFFSESKYNEDLSYMEKKTEKIAQESLLPACKLLIDEKKKLTESAEIKAYINTIQTVRFELSQQQEKMMKFKEEYSQFLQEKTAGVLNESQLISSVPDNIRKEYLALKTEITNRETAIKNTEVSMVAQSQSLLNTAQTEKEAIEKKLEKLEFWYPVKLTAYQSILIFPLLFLTFLLYQQSLRNNRLILRSLAANSAAITSLFALWILIKTIYWLLPKKLLADVYNWLEATGFLVIWDYAIIVIGLIIFGALIFFSQRGAEKWKKIREEQRKEEIQKNLTRIQKERSLRGVCYSCEVEVKNNQIFCSVCGTELLKPCSKCKHPFSKVLDFCDACGATR